MSVRRRIRSAGAVWAPSRLRRISRRRSVWLCAAGALVLFGSLSVQAQVAAVEDARLEWGEVEVVAVVTTPVEAGGLLSGSFELRELPSAMVPPTALAEIVEGSRAKVSLFVGEIVHAGRVTSELGPQVPIGAMALTLPVSARVPLVDIGDLVDLWMIDGGDLSSRRVAHSVFVLGLTDDNITVAVPEAQVAEATLASLRPVTVVLIG